MDVTNLLVKDAAFLVLTNDGKGLEVDVSGLDKCHSGKGRTDKLINKYCEKGYVSDNVARTRKRSCLLPFKILKNPIACS